MLLVAAAVIWGPSNGSRPGTVLLYPLSQSVELKVANHLRKAQKQTLQLLHFLLTLKATIARIFGDSDIRCYDI